MVVFDPLQSTQVQRKQNDSLAMSLALIRREFRVYDEMQVFLITLLKGYEVKVVEVVQTKPSAKNREFLMFWWN
jgi:hypothetical protein